MPDDIKALEAEMSAADEAGDIRKVLEIRRKLKATKAASVSSATDDARAKYEGVDEGTPFGGMKPAEDKPTPMEQLGYSASQMVRGGLELPVVFGADALPGAAALREGEAQYRDIEGIGDSVVDRSPTILESLGPAASMLAFRNPGAGAATRMASAVTTNASLGALSPADTPEEQRSNAMWSGAFGGAFQALPELFSGLRNLRHSRERAATETNTYKEGLRLEQRTGIPLSEGARSLDPHTLQKEAEAFGAAKEAFRQDEIPASLRYFNRVADKLDPTTIPDAKLIQQMDEAFEGHIKNLAGVRRTEWQEAASKIRAEAGTKTLFYPDKLAAKLQDLSEEGLKIVPMISDAEAKAFGATLDKIMSKKGLDIDDVDRMLQSLTADSASSGVIFRDMKPDAARRIAGDLKSLLKDDIAAAVERAPGNKALTMLEDARAQYAKNSVPIDDLRGTVLDKWFGKDAHIVPETVLDKLSKLPPSEIETATRLLDKVDPSIMEKARGKVVRQAINKAYNAKRAANEPEYRLTELAGALEKDQEHFRMVFPDPTVRAEIMDGINAIRRLAASDSQRMGPSIGSEIRSATTGAAYLNPVSAAGRIAQHFTASNLEYLFFTPEGRKIVTQLSIPNPSWQQRAAAAAGLVRIAQED